MVDITPETVAKIYDLIAKMAVSKFNVGGSLAPVLAGVSLSDDPENPISCVMEIDPLLVANMCRDADTMQALSLLVRMLLDETSPLREELSADGAPPVHVVVQINEGWMSRVQEGQSAPMVAPSDDPNREEAIVVFLHTPGRTDVGICPIESTSEGGRKCAAYRPMATLAQDEDDTGPMSMRARTLH